jgi:hypothetical protein
MRSYLLPGTASRIVGVILGDSSVGSGFAYNNSLEYPIKSLFLSLKKGVAVISRLNSPRSHQIPNEVPEFALRR